VPGVFNNSRRAPILHVIKIDTASAAQEAAAAASYLAPAASGGIAPKRRSFSKNTFHG